MKCNHIDCRDAEKVWLPYIVRMNKKGLKSHSFCIRYGTIKNIGSDRAKYRDYFINVISQLEEHLNTRGSSSWMHLIVKNLEKIEDFDDSYFMNKYGQEGTSIRVL